MSETKPLSKSDRQKLILKSIKSGKNLIRSISTETKIDGGVVRGELEEMQGTTVDFIKTDSFTAWFLSGEAPTERVFLDGNGGIRIISDEEKGRG